MENYSNTQPSNRILPIHLLVDVTPREWAVLLDVSKDLTNAEIANRLCLTVKSVVNYRTRVGTKLGCEGSGSLGRFARQHQAELRQWYELISGKPSVSE